MDYEELAGLSVEKLKLFYSLLHENNIDFTQFPIQDHAHRKHAQTKNEFPLTFSQQHMWLNQQFDTNHAIYHMPAIIRLMGNLDFEALEKSFQEIINRHSILKCCFFVTENGPKQKQVELCDFKIKVHDLTKYSKESNQGNSQEKNKGKENLPQARYDVHDSVIDLFKEFNTTPFDLAKAPLFRVSLAKVSEEIHYLFFCMHHIISDAWSIKIVCQELNYYYNFFTKHEKSNFKEPDVTESNPVDAPKPLMALKELKHHYLDYVIWQQELLPDAIYERKLEYWKKQLEDIDPILNLPTDWVRPAVQSFFGEKISFDIPSDIVNKLYRIAKSHEVTPFIILFAAFNLLLSRYSGQKDILVGLPVANRRSEFENLIGYFTNILIIRNKFSETHTVIDFLVLLKEVVLSANEHEVPFEKVLELINPPRDLGRHPLFQVMFNFNKYTDSKIEFTGLKAEHLKTELEISKFDLTLFVEEGAGDEPDQGRSLVNLNIIQICFVWRQFRLWQAGISHC